MHHTKKKKALGLIGEEKDQDKVTEILTSNEFSSEEINEILDGLHADDKADEETTPPKATQQGKSKKAAVAGFDEYRCEVKHRPGEKPLVEKLKKLRSNIKISQAEADTLNSGAMGPDATNPIMYYPAS